MLGVQQIDRVVEVVEEALKVGLLFIYFGSIRFPFFFLAEFYSGKE